MVSVAAGDGLAYLLQNAAPEGVIALGLGAAAEGGGVGNRIGDLIFGVEGVADIISYTLNGGLTSLASDYEEYF